jgi:hypothetical protein
MVRDIYSTAHETSKPPVQTPAKRGAIEDLLIPGCFLVDHE